MADATTEAEGIAQAIQDTSLVVGTENQDTSQVIGQPGIHSDKKLPSTLSTSVNVVKPTAQSTVSDEELSNDEAKAKLGSIALYIGIAILAFIFILIIFISCRNFVRRRARIHRRRRQSSGDE